MDIKDKKKKIVTRPDFDGVVCAVLLIEAENGDENIKWTEPNEIQNNEVEIEKGDIIANLPFHENCHLWFDHHQSNIIEDKFNGKFQIAPSAAGVIFQYYKDKGFEFKKDYLRLIQETDRIDSAQLTKDEILNPEKYPYIALSMSVSALDDADEYWNKVVRLLSKMEIEDIVKDIDIKNEIKKLDNKNSVYKKLLLKYTRFEGQVSITDLRSIKNPPNGNRFLVFSLFPETNVNVKIRYTSDGSKVIVSVGHSIFNRTCEVNSGFLVANHGGGGHFGAGSCNFPTEEMEEHIRVIINTLVYNKEISNGN